MKIIDSELLVQFDIDSTLVFDCLMTHPDAIKIDYYGTIKYVRPHFRHIELLKSFHARKYFVIVASANGHSWAQSVVNLLKLDSYVDLIMTKVKTYVDDLPCEKWMCDHVYIKDRERL